MVATQNSDFKFFMPLEITKGKDASGKEVMKIGGIASTADKDSDGEVLEPEGYDLTYFLKNGFINWHHQSKTNPSAVIGEPTKAEITNDGLYIEGELYKDSPVAKQVWDLAQTLEKSSKGRRLGFSIEGKAMERDLLDKKRITKAKITGVAITPSPKNPCTIMDIVKGDVTGYEPEFNIEGEQSNDANGGNTNIIDIFKPNGERIVVDKDYNVKIIQKSLDTTSGVALKKEDVEDGVKNLQGSEKKIKKSFTYSDETGNFVSLNKANLFSEVCTYTDDIAKAKQVTEQVFENLKNFDMVNKEIKSDEIVKALAALGIENADEIVKAGMSDEDIPEDGKKEDSEDSDETKKKQVAKKDADTKDDDLDEMQKAFDEKQKELDDMKSKIENKKASKAPKKQEDDSEDKEDITKAFEDFQEQTKTEIEKANSAISDKLDGFFEKFDEFKKGMEERFEKLESAPATGRKSVTTQNFIEKSFGDEQANAIMKGKQALSISKNKQQVSDLLLAKSGIEKGEANDFYVNALTGYEATGSISKAVINDLFHNHNVLVVQ